MDRHVLYTPCSRCIMTQSGKMCGTVIILYFAGFLTVTSSENATNKTQPKIIGGQPIDIKYRPFMLSLHDSSGFLCGASILSGTWAVTALHCLIPVSPSQYYVRAGSNKASKDGSVHKVMNIHVYNDTSYSWSSTFFYYDIALLEVKPSFRFSRTVRPIHLPKPTYEIPRHLLVCGWGRTSTERIAKTLMSVWVEYVPFETCIKASSSYASVVKNEHHLCYGSRGKDACYGDSGGALASRRTIYGIVSFGTGCGKVTGIYVKILYYLKWIKAVTNL